MPTVLLTGASGFVAVAVLKALLDRGYDVIGTVRSESKTQHLRNKFSKFVDDGKLKFAIVPDMVVDGAFDEVLKTNRFDAVVHTSSPYYLDAKDAQKDMLDPAIKGTTGILESVSKHAPTVKRVVITGTFANIVNIPKGAWPGKVYTEDDWSPVTLEDAYTHPVMAYVAGKVFAEKAAWDFIDNRKPHFTISILCPPNVFGPPEQEMSSLKQLNTSNTDIYEVFNGTSDLRFTAWIWVDVRDLAVAHVLAIDAPAAANQRYLVTNGSYSAQAIADYIWKHYPERAAAKGVKKGNPGQLYPETGVYKADNSKSIRDLGLTYRYDFDRMLKDTLNLKRRYLIHTKYPIMSTPDLPTTTLTESSSPAIETLPPEPSNTSRAVPSAKYLYGIILVALILFLFICFCTTREVVRRQQRESFPQSSSQSDEEKEPTLEPPRIYDVHLEEPAAHSFHETSEQSLNLHNTKVLSISFVSQAPTTVKSSHISFISAFKRLVADKLGTIKVQIKRRALLQVDAPNLTFDLSSPHTPKPSITLSTVFISMPTPGRPRSHEKRPSFAMSENSGEWTLRESSGHSEEIVFGIHEQSWL